MNHIYPAAMFWILAGFLLVGSPGSSSSVHAQTATVTYDLKDVWLLPDTSHPRAKARPMTGTFVWTYIPGKFSAGSGKFVNLAIPWWGTRTTPALNQSLAWEASPSPNISGAM